MFVWHARYKRRKGSYSPGLNPRYARDFNLYRKISTFVALKKAFHILFTIYFLALAVVPCADKGDCNEYKQTSLTQSAHQENHSDEVCTPFCVCSCCAAHFVVKDLETSLQQIAVINTVYTPLKEAKTSAAVIPIWQPPKLG